MIVKSVYSPDVYRKIMNANQEKMIYTATN